MWIICGFTELPTENSISMAFQPAVVRQELTYAIRLNRHIEHMTCSGLREVSVVGDIFPLLHQLLRDEWHWAPTVFDKVETSL
jgi:hypothetical protein